MADEHPGETDNKDEGFEKIDFIVIAVLSLAAISSLYLVELGMHLFISIDPGAWIANLVPLLLLLPLPMAYIASISHERVHWECLGTLVTVPFAYFGIEFAAVSAGLVLGSIMVSFKAKSIYKGTNAGWTYFKASGAAVTILALVLGLVVANMYLETPELRQDIRDNLTEQTLDVAMEYADLGNVQEDAGSAQQDALRDVATTLAHNISTASITATEAIVLRDAQDAGTFDAQEIQLLRGSFNEAENTVPSEMAQQTDQIIADRFSTSTPESPELQTSTIRGVAEPRIRGLLSSIIAPTQEAAIGVFVVMFSIVMVFKLPFEFIAAIYAFVFGSIRNRAFKA